MRRRETLRNSGGGRLRRAVLAVTTTVSLLLLGVGGVIGAAPAYAGEECTDVPVLGLYCGSVVNRQARPVTIAYKWCGSVTTGWPCASSDPQQRITTLSNGLQTPWNEDWDAFAVDPGCTYHGKTYTLGLGTNSWSFSGGDYGKWFKVTDVQDVTVEWSSCSSLSDRESYRVKNANSGLCLVARNAAGESPVVQSTCGNWADQRWYLVTAGTFYRLQNYNSDKCVAARGSGESGAVATTCGDWADQKWIEENLGGGVLRYRNVASGLCLVARGSGESRAVQSTCGDWADQKWSRSVW